MGHEAEQGMQEAFAALDALMSENPDRGVINLS
jgi:hypothetical protein